jgi:hypothetical protein
MILAVVKVAEPLRKIEIDLEKLESLYSSGCQTFQIADYFGCCTSTINNKLRDAALSSRKSGHIPKISGFSRKERINFLDELKLEKSCMDCKAVCGEFWGTESFQFDHLSEFEKKFELGKGGPACRSTLSKDEIFEEVEKCDLVCANCHLSRTRLRSRKRTRS